MAASSPVERTASTWPQFSSWTSLAYTTVRDRWYSTGEYVEFRSSCVGGPEFHGPAGVSSHSLTTMGGRAMCPLPTASPPLPKDKARAGQSSSLHIFCCHCPGNNHTHSLLKN